MKKLVGLFCLMLPVLSPAEKSISISKDTVYLDKYQAEITNKRKAQSYRIITRDSVDINTAVARTYFINGKQKSEVKLANEATLADRQWKTNAVRMMFLDTDDKTLWTLNGKYIEWFETGKPKKIIDYKNGYFANRLQVFRANGMIKRNEK